MTTDKELFKLAPLIRLEAKRRTTLISRVRNTIPDEHLLNKTPATVSAESHTHGLLIRPDAKEHQQDFCLLDTALLMLRARGRCVRYGRYDVIGYEQSDMLVFVYSAAGTKPDIRDFDFEDVEYGDNDYERPSGPIQFLEIWINREDVLGIAWLPPSFFVRRHLAHGPWMEAVNSYSEAYNRALLANTLFQSATFMSKHGEVFTGERKMLLTHIHRWAGMCGTPIANGGLPAAITSLRAWLNAHPEVADDVRRLVAERAKSS